MDYDYIVGVKLYRTNTGSLLMVRFKKPMHFSRLFSFLNRKYSGWAIWCIFNTEKEMKLFEGNS